MEMDKKTSITVAIAVVIVLVIIGGIGLNTNLFNSENKNETKNMQQDTTVPNNSSQTLQQIDTVVGTGATALSGKTITVNYTGKFSDGSVFDSSVGKTPFTFVLGAGMVIKGWDIGVEGMKVGGKRMLIIPPELGYGANDYGPIPGNSTLIFDVELLKVE